MSKVLPIVVVLLLAAGCRNESQMTPAFIGVSSAQSEPANYYLPAGFVIQPNESEPEVYEYY
jgi:hypothetical protein